MLGTILRQIYVIWNRAYKQQMVIAESPQEALQLSMASSHIKRSNNYRRFADCTDEYIASQQWPGLEKALDAGRSGIADLTSEGWTIDGDPLPS